MATEEVVSWLTNQTIGEQEEGRVVGEQEEGRVVAEEYS